MKVMISLPMSGKTDEYIENEIKKVTDKLAELHIDVVASNFQQDPPENCQHPALYFMAKSINMIANVDAVFFHKDWRSARGCRIEREICRVYGVKILDWSFAFDDDNIRYKTRYFKENNKNEEKPISLSDTNDSITKTKDIITRYDNHIPHLD